MRSEGFVQIGYAERDIGFIGGQGSDHAGFRSALGSNSLNEGYTSSASNQKRV